MDLGGVNLQRKVRLEVGWVFIAAVAVSLQWILAQTFESLWWRALWFYVIVCPVSAALLGPLIEWKYWLRFPSLDSKDVAAKKAWKTIMITAVVTAFILYVACWMGNQIIGLVAPSLLGQKTVIYRWSSEVPFWQGIPLLAVIVLGEQFFWGLAIGIPAAVNHGYLVGSMISGLAFALANCAVSPPILWVICFISGTYLSALILARESIVEAYFCHLIWTILTVYVFPI